MDEEERAFRAAFGRLVEWYRVEQTRLLWRAFWPGALVLMPLGSVLVGLAMANKLVPYALQPALTLAGVLIIGCGPLWAIAYLLRSIQHDLYVAIRVDGLCVRLDPAREEQVYGWDAIVDARYDDARRVISISLADDEEPCIIAGSFSRLDLPELSRRIRDARRLAVWNRLEPRFQCAEAGE
jgi:hypothetical protein